jgi:hypothetical protein
MATGSMSGVASLRTGSEITPDAATELGEARQWSGAELRPGAFSGQSGQCGFPSSGQQSRWCVAAAQVTAGTATLNSESHTTNSLARRLFNWHSVKLPRDRWALSQMFFGNASPIQPGHPAQTVYLSRHRQTLVRVGSTANARLAVGYQ